MIARIAYVAGAVLAVCAALVVGFAPAPWQAVGDFLIIRDPLEPVDAVIAITGDGTGERVDTATALLKRGYARWLILSGGTGGYARGGATAAMHRRALRSGVPADSILVDKESSSTGDNARQMALLMKQRGFQQAILVTSPYHTRRAAVIFRREFLPKGLTLRVYAAEQSFFDVRRWWTRSFHRSLVLREYMKLLGFLLLGRLTMAGG